MKKINRVLNSQSDDLQASIFNNLKSVRLAAGLKQDDVVERMRAYDPHFDAPMLSKFENGFCMPTPYQLAHLARIYGVQPYKQEQINEIIEVFKDAIGDNALIDIDAEECTLDCTGVDHAAEQCAESLYNLGYRKTFTSAFASDTQKAFKEGYQKGKENT